MDSLDVKAFYNQINSITYQNLKKEDLLDS